LGWKPSQSTKRIARDPDQGLEPGPRKKSAGWVDVGVKELNVIKTVNCVNYEVM
jgi:hypothetical protein